MSEDQKNSSETGKKKPSKGVKTAAQILEAVGLGPDGKPKKTDKK